MKFGHRPPNSFVDYLARNLSEKTGSQFEVVRRREHKRTLYGLQVRRDGNIYQFGGTSMSVDELKRWLATISDMVGMGFLLVLPKANVAEWLAVQRNWDAVRAMLVLTGEV